MLLFPRHPPVGLWPWGDSLLPAEVDPMRADGQGQSKGSVHSEGTALLGPALPQTRGGLTWGLSASPTKASARRIFSISISRAMSCFAW